MSFDVRAFASDPSQYIFDFDKQDAVVIPMTRGDFLRSIFLDGRIRRSVQKAAKLPSLPLAQAVGSIRDFADSETRIGWIFHVAQCGSTLLSRALDFPGRSLGLREPATLRSLGVQAGGDRQSKTRISADDFGARLDLSLRALSRHWPGERPVVKANVPVNFIAHAIMERMPDAPAILLHFPVEDYVAAIMRTDGHEEWTERVYAELALQDSPYAEGAVPKTTAERAALLWFAQMKAYEALTGYANVKSLSADIFLERPAETIAAAGELFKITLSEGEAEDIADSELFHSYSKNPALDYDPEVREARAVEAKRRLRPQLAEAHAWVERAAARHGLTDALASPLIGEPVPLLG